MEKSIRGYLKALARSDVGQHLVLRYVMIDLRHPFHQCSPMVPRAERLHMLQNRFQSMVVVAASFLLISQVRNQHAASAAPGTASTVASSLSSPPSTRGHQPLHPLDPQETKRRLQILLADPSLHLQNLVTELAALSGLPQMGLSPEAQLQVKILN